MAHQHSNDEMITGINVTPLVDVVLVVLVILMLTASSIVARALPLDLPSAKTSEGTDTTLNVSITKDGAVHLQDRRIPVEELGAHARRAASTNPELRAMIAADGQARHVHVVRVIDTLREAGVLRLAFHVNPAPDARKEE